VLYVSVKVSLNDIFQPPDGLSVWFDRPNRLSFSQLVAMPLWGVRNVHDWPVGPQIGHSAVKQLDDSIQTRVRTVHEKMDLTQYPILRPQFRLTKDPMRFTVRTHWITRALTRSPENVV